MNEENAENDEEDTEGFAPRLATATAKRDEEREPPPATWFDAVARKISKRTKAKDKLKGAGGSSNGR